MRALLLPVVVAALAAVPSPAQRTLASIRASFETARADLVKERGRELSLDDHKRLTRELAAELEDFLAKDAKGDDRAQARLLLTGVRLDAGEIDQAKATLKALDPKDTSMLSLLQGAEMAQGLGLTEQRQKWVEAALKKPDVPFTERMKAAAVLMTRLVEPARAEALFERALQEAGDDARRAEVMWWRASAVREREDREDGDYEKALEEVAEKFPDTTFGGIARDRLRAMAYQVGQAVVPITGTDLEGKPVALSDYRGKVVLLDFFAAWNDRCKADAKKIAALRAKFAERGFDVLGVALDEDRAAVERFVKELGVTWRVMFDGKGLESPVALRSNVEQVPDHLLVDREGKIAAMRVSLFDDDDVTWLEREIEKALVR
jgi:peroxiredoxin